MRASSHYTITGACLVACWAASATACTPPTRTTPADTLVVLVPALIRDVDPRFASSSHDPKMGHLVAPGLTSIDDASLEPRLELAASIDPVDERTWDISLRADARFGDGSPVTAHDVVFTYRSVMSRELESPYRRQFLDRYEQVVALDDQRVRFVLAKPLATLMGDLDFGIVSQNAAGEGGRFDRGMAVGAGPFRVVSLESEKLVLERNPHYYGDPAPLARLVFRTVRDTGARTLMLIGGSADITQNTMRVDLMGEIAKQKRVKLATGPSVILTYLMMQNEDPLLSDVRVRRAIAHAIDRNRIIEAKFHGYAVPATGLIAPAHWAYAGDVPRYPYDPGRAMQLLDEAGYPDPDGPGGEPRFSITYKTSADQFRLVIAQLLAAQLREVGIAVEVRSFEFHTFFADVKKGNFQIATMQTAAITDPDWLFTYFHSSRIPSATDPHTHNRWRYRSDRVDELTRSGRSVMDRERRREMYGEVQRVLATDLPIVPLWHEDNIAVMNVTVGDYALVPSARYGGMVKATKQAVAP